MKTLFCALLLFAIPTAFCRDVYISSSSGSDSNDGSKGAPYKTIAAAPKTGANIFLKRGDVFYEQLRDFTDCNIDAYGDGAPPQICGLRIVENLDAWVKMPNGIWRIDMLDEKNFGGMRDSSDRSKLNIGAVYDMSSDKVYGHLVWRLSALNSDGDFFAAEGPWAKGPDVATRGHKFRYLYFKFPENPSAGGRKIAFVTASHGISRLKNCSVKNIAVKGFGLHGVCQTRNCRFDSLDIDLIGGSIQPGYSGGYVRFGNGIEFWITSKNPANGNRVTNCRVSRTYDCGATIQGISDGDLLAKDISFSNNVFYRCRQAFEHFLRSKTGGTVAYENCEFSDNLAYQCGNNEFSCPETRDAALLSHRDLAGASLVVKNNVFWDSNGYFVTKFPVSLKGNSFYVRKGQYLLASHLSDDKPLWVDSPADVEEFKKRFPSNDVIFIGPENQKVGEEILKKAARK